MTYRCGIGEGMQAYGLQPGPPMVRCDYDGCSAFVEAKATRGGPPAWLRNGTAPRGWSTVRHPSGKRYDLCPAHRAAGSTSGGKEK